LAGNTSRLVAPSAAALIDSLRGVGYSLETAIADLIDNSITAGAGVVDLRFEWRDGAPVTVLLDDGRGMTDAELELAMKFGGTGAWAVRAEDDLGRFGLGLKTASLSQARRVTVATVKAGSRAVLRWDLDYIRHVEDGWHLLEGCEPGSEPLLEPLLLQDHGTLVLWELIDFGRREEPPNYSSFLEDIEAVEHHLAMVFHRFLNGDARRLKILINGRKVTGWDPFLESHGSVRPRPEQKVGQGAARAVVRGFILPHRDRFASAKAYEDAGGPAGWNAQQGFYIYRNKRLLSAGGWLGLGGSRAWTREESSRLGRIRVDLANAADADWNIDVKKSVARPPVALRPRLSVIAQDVRAIARAVFVHRGAYGPRVKSAEVERLWEPLQTASRSGYRIRRDHPAVEAATPSGRTEREAFLGLLTLAERTVPVDRIWLDVTERSADGGPPAPDEVDDELMEAARGLAAILIRRGFPKAAAVARVAALEPYDTVPEFAARLKKRLGAETGPGDGNGRYGR